MKDTWATNKLFTAALAAGVGVSLCASPASRFPSRSIPPQYVTSSKLPGEIKARGKSQKEPGSKEELTGRADPLGRLQKGPSVVVFLSPSEVVLAEGKAPGEFILEEPVTVEVGSSLIRWAISCEAEPAVGPEDGVIPPEDIFVLPAKSPTDPKKKYSGSAINLAKPVLIGDGGATSRKMIEVNALHLNVKTDPLKPAGTYRGKIYVQRETPGSFPSRPRRPAGPKPGKGRPGKEEYVGVLTFSLTIPEYVNFSMDPEGMQFGSLMPGEREATRPVPLKVETNCHDLMVNLIIQELKHEDGKNIIPPENICLGAGLTPADAVRDAGRRRFGENAVIWKCDLGEQTFYIFCRLDVTFDIKAGKYGGVINLTYESPSMRAGKGGG
jgi:hypothetical protein